MRVTLTQFNQEAIVVDIDDVGAMERLPEKRLTRLDMRDGRRLAVAETPEQIEALVTLKGATA